MKILVVDDEPGVVEVLDEALRGAGHTVDTALDATIALRKIDARSYDVLILDIVMPGMSEAALFEELRRRRLPLVDRTIVIYALLNTSLREFFPDVHPWAYIEKPFEIERILAAIERLGG